MTRIALPLAWLLAAAPAAAQNLVVNGDFATNVAGWSNPVPSEIGFAWSELDPLDPTPSGSMQVTSTISNAGAQGPYQCVDTGEPVTMGMAILVPNQSFEYLYGNPFVRYYDAPGCGGAEVASEFPIGFVAMGEGWRRIKGVVTPPPTARSFRVFLGVWKPPTAWPATVHFDDVFVPEPDAGMGTACAFAALALVAGGRAEAWRGHAA